MRIINVKSRFKLTNFIVQHFSSNEIECMQEKKKSKQNSTVYKLLHQTNDSSNVVARDSLRIWIVITRHLCKHRNANQFSLTHSIFESVHWGKRSFFSLSFQFTLFWKSLNEKKNRNQNRKENVNSCGYPVSKFCFTFDLLVHWILNNKKEFRKTHAYGLCAYKPVVHVSMQTVNFEYTMHTAYDAVT